MWNGQILKTNKNCAKEKKSPPLDIWETIWEALEGLSFLPKFVLHMETVDLQHIIFETCIQCFMGFLKLAYH